MLGQLELQQLRAESPGRLSGALYQRVEVHRIVTQCCQKPRLLGCGARRLGGARARVGGLGGWHGRRWLVQAQLLQDVLRRLPLDSVEWIDPGTANTSRPCSPARRAVIRLPERSAASITSTPRASPAMIRLRRGKLCSSGGVPRGNSDSTNASRRRRSVSSRLLAG